MLRTLGIVQACFTRDAVRQSVAQRIGGRTILEWSVRRVTDCTRLDGVIVLTSDDPANDFVRRLVPCDVPVYVSDRPAALDRFVAALEEYPAESAVRVRADTPFVDPGLIDRLVATAESHAEADYIGYRCRDGRPALHSPIGVFAEWFRTAALRQAAGRGDADDRNDVTGRLYGHPEHFRVRLLAAPPRLDREDLRLAFEGPQDWEHAAAIFEALGPDECDWQRIAALLDHQPSLRRQMAELNRAAGS